MNLNAFFIGCCAVLILFADSARAQAPVAVVEQIDSKTAAIEFMDYLTTGQIIRLAPSDKLVIGYLKSCWREVIAGGTIIVGNEQSEVTNGEVERHKVRCDAGRKGSTTKETTGSGAMVFRKTPETASARRTVYALSPMFALASAGNLTVERLDKSEKGIAIQVTPSGTSRGLFLDLAKSNISLTAGGLYRARLGRSEVVFMVDPSAQAGSLPIVSRLVQLSPPG